MALSGVLAVVVGAVVPGVSGVAGVPRLEVASSAIWKIRIYIVKQIDFLFCYTTQIAGLIEQTASDCNWKVWHFGWAIPYHSYTYGFWAFDTCTWARWVQLAQRRYRREYPVKVSPVQYNGKPGKNGIESNGVRHKLQATLSTCLILIHSRTDIEHNGVVSNIRCWVLLILDGNAREDESAVGWAHCGHSTIIPCNTYVITALNCGFSIKHFTESQNR